MRIKYNAPTTLTYAFFCTLVVTVDQFLVHGLTRAFFTVPNALSFDLFNPLSYLRLFTHIAGHADWNHLLSNLAYILLLGPMLEETYGSLTMFLMIVVTGFVTGVLNACFFPHPLLGASGVVFMMILLASFTNSGKDEIPLTFILIMLLYLGREILNAFRGDDISQFAHLAGGLCGSLFGFFQPSKSGTARKMSKGAPATRRSPATEPRTAATSRAVSTGHAPTAASTAARSPASAATRSPASAARSPVSATVRAPVNAGGSSPERNPVVKTPAAKTPARAPVAKTPSVKTPSAKAPAKSPGAKTPSVKAPAAKAPSAREAESDKGPATAKAKPNKATMKLPDSKSPTGGKPRSR